MRATKQRVAKVAALINFATANIVYQDKYQKPYISMDCGVIRSFGELVKSIHPDIVPDIISKLKDNDFLEYLKITPVWETEAPPMGTYIIFQSHKKYLDSQLQILVDDPKDENTRSIHWVKGAIKDGEIDTILTFLTTKLYSTVTGIDFEQLIEDLENYPEGKGSISLKMDLITSITEGINEELSNPEPQLFPTWSGRSSRNQNLKESNQTEQAPSVESECTQTPTAETKEVNEMQTDEKELYKSVLPRGMSQEQYECRVLTAMLVLGISLDEDPSKPEEKFITLPLLKNIVVVANAMLPECIDNMLNDASDPSVDRYFDGIELSGQNGSIVYPPFKGILSFLAHVNINAHIHVGVIGLMVNHLLYLYKDIIPCERDVFLSNVKKVKYGSNVFAKLISSLDLKISTTLEYPWLEPRRATRSSGVPFWKKNEHSKRSDSSRRSGPASFHRRGSTSNDSTKTRPEDSIVQGIGVNESNKVTGLTGKVYDGLYHSEPTHNFTDEAVNDASVIATAILMLLTSHKEHQRHLPHRRYFTAFLAYLNDICPGIIVDVDIMLGVFKSNNKLNPNVRLVKGVINTEIDNRTLAIDLSSQGCGLNSLKVVLYLMIYSLIKHELLSLAELKDIINGEYKPSRFQEPLITQLLRIVDCAQTHIVDRELSSIEVGDKPRRQAFQNAPEETYKDEMTNDTLSMLLSIRAIKTTLATLTEFNCNEDDLRKCMANSQQLFQNFNQLFKGYVFKRINFEANEPTLTIINTNFGIHGIVAEIMDILNECDTTLSRSHQVELILLKLIKLYPLYNLLSSCVYP